MTGAADEEHNRTSPQLPEPAPKISQDDPSLQVARPVGRRLRKGPAALVLSAVIGVPALLIGVANSVRGSANTKTEQESQFDKPIIPDSILKADITIEPDAPPPTAPVEAQEPEPPPPAVPAVPARPAGKGSGREGQYSAAALEEKRIADHWKARAAGILVSLGPDPAIEDEMPQELADGDPHTDGMQDPSGTGSGAVPAGGSLLVEADQNLQGRKNQFVAGARSGYVRAVRRPRSPFELKPGTIVPAVLLTAVNSDLPGPVIARVTQNICDTVEGQWLLIPQGTTLLADYDSMVSWGQERVLVCWRQFELPSGDSVDIGCMPGADATGAAGFHDQVDEHWWRLIKGAAVASLLSAVTTAAAGNTTGYNPTVPQLWARGAASEVASVGQQITGRNMRIQPTLTIRQGMPVNVILTKTIDFQPEGPGTPCRPEGL